MGYLEPEDGGNQVGSATPNKIGNSYTDFLACWSAQLAILAALYRRAATGRGVWIDLAMYQTGVSFLGEGLLDYAFNGRRTRRLGNRHESLSPHGCYPCNGEDRWVVLSVRDEDDWQGLCVALGRSDLVSDPCFLDPLARHRNQDELNQIIIAWCREQTQEEVVAALHSCGVPAAPVLDAGQLVADPHLRGRGLFEAVEHPVSGGLGKREYLGRGWRLGDADVQIKGPAPDLGEANELVLCEMLGLTTDDIEQLRRDDIVGEKLTGASVPNVVPLDRQLELGWIAGFQDE